MNVGELLKTANRLKREGQLDEAIALYHQAIEINPNFSWAYHNLGEAFVKQGKIEKASACYLESLKINPNSAWLCYCLGEILAKQGDLEAAVEYLQKAIEIKPYFYKFYQALGAKLILQDNFDEAITNYNNAAKLNPEKAYLNHSIIIEYAQIAMTRSNWLAAIKLWTIDLEFQGENAPANTYAQLSFAYRKIRALDTAEAITSRGIVKYPNNITLDSELAEIAIAKKKHPEAIVRLQNLLIRYDKSHTIVQKSLNKLLSILLDDKIWLYTLMKSGTTYTLMVLANYIAQLQGINDKIDFDSIGKYGFVHGLNVYELLTNKNVINNLLSTKTDYPIYHTHTYVDTNFRKIIMLIRNPLDFIVSSYFFHFKNRGKNVEIKEVIDSRIKHFSATYLNQKKILDERPEHSILINYEELITETKSVFTKIINHLSLEFNDSYLMSAIDACSVDNVRKMEKKQRKPLVVGDKIKVESFIRSGKIGEWKEYLSESDLHQVARQLRKNAVDPKEFEELRLIL
ncbi:MAG: tetratricopeptide repeat protein [Cyanobacteria bacterium J06592_8]